MKAVILVLLTVLQAVLSYSRYPCSHQGYNKYLEEYSSKGISDGDSDYE